MAQAQPSTGVLVAPVARTLLPLQAQVYTVRVGLAAAAAAAVTLGLHSLGGGLGGIAPHLVLTAAMTLILSVGRPAAGLLGWAQRAVAGLLAAATLTLMVETEPTLACLGAGAWLGLGLSPQDPSFQRRLGDGVALAGASLAAGLVYGTLAGTGHLGDLPPLIQTGVCGALWGLVLAAGAGHRHWVLVRHPAMGRLEALATRLAEPGASRARRLTALAKLGLEHWTPEIAGDLERYQAGLDPLARALHQAAEDLEALADRDAAPADNLKRLSVARQASEQAVEEATQRDRVALVARLEARQQRLEAREVADERRRSRLDLTEVCLEEAAAGQDPAEAWAALG